jgi:probable HAF family extracellular repeat protein
MPPSGINNAGEIVGTIPALFYEPVPPEGYVYKDDVVTVLNVLGTTGLSVAGVNNSGEIAGTIEDIFNGGTYHGFIDNHGTITELNVPGATGTETTGINDAGQVVGESFDSLGVPHPFLYSNGIFTAITPPDDPSAQVNVTGINNQGEIIGYYEITTHTSSEYVSFVYEDGTYTTLSMPGFYLLPNGINNEGEIVGGASDGGSDSDAFVATPTLEPALEPASLLLVSTGALLFLLPRFRRQYAEGGAGIDHVHL